MSLCILKYPNFINIRKINSTLPCNSGCRPGDCFRHRSMNSFQERRRIGFDMSNFIIKRLKSNFIKNIFFKLFPKHISFISA